MNREKAETSHRSQSKELRAARARPRSSRHARPIHTYTEVSLLVQVSNSSASSACPLSVSRTANSANPPLHESPSPRHRHRHARSLGAFTRPESGRNGGTTPDWAARREGCRLHAAACLLLLLLLTSTRRVSPTEHDPLPREGGGKRDPTQLLKDYPRTSIPAGLRS